MFSYFLVIYVKKYTIAGIVYFLISEKRTAEDTEEEKVENFINDLGSL
jgi:hypothetical protein